MADAVRMGGQTKGPRQNRNEGRWGPIAGTRGTSGKYSDPRDGNDAGGSGICSMCSCSALFILDGGRANVEGTTPGSDAGELLVKRIPFPRRMDI